MTAKEFPFVFQVRDVKTNNVLAEIRTHTGSLALDIMGSYFDRIKSDQFAPDVKITDEFGGVIHAPIASLVGGSNTGPPL